MRLSSYKWKFKFVRELRHYKSKSFYEKPYWLGVYRLSTNKQINRWDTLQYIRSKRFQKQLLIYAKADFSISLLNKYGHINYTYTYNKENLNLFLEDNSLRIFCYNYTLICGKFLAMVVKNKFKFKKTLILKFLLQLFKKRFNLFSKKNNLLFNLLFKKIIMFKN